MFGSLGAVRRLAICGLFCYPAQARRRVGLGYVSLLPRDYDSGLHKNLTENSPRLSPMAVTKRKTKKLPADS